MHSKPITCPTCRSPLSLFMMWAKQVRLNQFKCKNCNRISEFANSKTPSWVNLLSLVVFAYLAYLSVELIGNMLGMFVPVLIYLPVGYGLHLYYCKSRSLVLVKCNANKSLNRGS